MRACVCVRVCVRAYACVCRYKKANKMSCGSQNSTPHPKKKSRFLFRQSIVIAPQNPITLCI